MAIEREESLRRLSHIIDIHMFDEDNPEHHRIWKEAGSWEAMWDRKTSQVKVMTENWLAWIMGETDIISPSG